MKRTMSQNKSSVLAETLTAVASCFGAIAKGTVECPECGSCGPHESQSYYGDTEFSCCDCGTQFAATPITV